MSLPGPPRRRRRPSSIDAFLGGRVEAVQPADRPSPRRPRGGAARGVARLADHRHRRRSRRRGRSRRVLRRRPLPPGARSSSSSGMPNLIDCARGSLALPANAGICGPRPYRRRRHHRARGGARRGRGRPRPRRPRPPQSAILHALRRQRLAGGSPGRGACPRCRRLGPVVPRRGFGLEIRRRRNRDLPRRRPCRLSSPLRPGASAAPRSCRSCPGPSMPAYRILVRAVKGSRAGAEDPAAAGPSW